VLVYNGYYAHWLDGDGAPGWEGDIWFSDLAQALTARNRFRRVGHGSWLPDILQEEDWAEMSLTEASARAALLEPNAHLDYLLPTARSIDGIGSLGPRNRW
jgi:hypothetical protein